MWESRQVGHSIIFENQIQSCNLIVYWTCEWIVETLDHQETTSIQTAPRSVQATFVCKKVAKYFQNQ